MFVNRIQQLSILTDLSAITAPVDLTGGLKITQGAETKVADFSTAQTVQDLINIINNSGVSVLARINCGCFGP